MAQVAISDSLNKQVIITDSLNVQDSFGIPIINDSLFMIQIRDTSFQMSFKDSLRLKLLLSCSVTSISPSSVSIGPAGGQVSPSIVVNTSPSNCTTYSYYTSYSWIHYQAVPGRGIVTVDALYGPTRNGTVSIGSYTLNVQQTCGSNPVAPSSLSVDRNNICSNTGGNITLTANSGSGVYTRWFAGSCGGTQVGYTSGASVTITAPTTTTTYYGRWETGCGNSTCSSITVTVNQAPVISSISGTTPVCPGSTYRYTAGNTGLTTYNWSIPSGSTGSSSTYYIDVTFGTTSGNVSVSGTDAHGCTSNTATYGVTVSYLTHYTASGGGTTCPGVGINVGLQGTTAGIEYRCYRNGSLVSPPKTSVSGEGLWWSNSSPGTYTFTGKTGTCEIPMDGSATINNNTLSTAPSSIYASVNPICQNGSGTTLSPVGGSLGTGASWKWYTGACGTENGGTLIYTGSSCPVNPLSTTTYWVRAEGTCNNTTCASITVTVLIPPVITQHPTDVTICAGASTSFSVSASGATSYQWQNLIGGTWSNISGATSTTYSISNTTGMDGRGFKCVVSGSCSFTTTSNPAYIHFSYLYPYTVHSQWTTICPGDANEITLDGSSTNTSIWYTLYLNGSPLSGPQHGTGGQLSFGNRNSAGTYTVKAVNTDGCVIQMNGNPTLTVRIPSTAPTSITTTKTDICSGGNPGGGATLTLQGGSLEAGYGSWHWYSGGTPCGSTTEGTGTTSITVSPNITTTYSVRAEGGCIITSCANIQVNVKPPTTISVQPVNSNVSLGSDATFSVTATGPNLQYQWQVSPDGVNNWTDLTGLPAQNYQTANLTIKGSTTFEDNSYKCKITSDCSTIYSNVVKIVLTFSDTNYLWETQDPENRSLNPSFSIGSIKGNLSINPIGGSSYNIQLETPSGVNGLSPNLSLVYSSSSGSGIAGYGWQIAGISSINRGPENIYNDGATSGIRMDVNDRYYLDGQRLVNTRGTYGDYSTDYMTENDIFTRVTPQGMSSSGPAWFKAETKAGLICEYGNAVGSVQTLNGFSQILGWYISKISDLYGNQILFSYIRNKSILYPSEINYGNNKIKFIYSTRLDHQSSYIKGSKIEQDLILNKIVISYNLNIIKQYQFNQSYQGSSYNQYSLLNEIVEYGKGSSQVNSTIISYQIPSDVSFSQTLYNTSHQYITYYSKLVAGDFNGDGKPDLLCIPDPSKGATWTGTRIYYGDGADNFPTYSSSSMTLDINRLKDIRALDLNADGTDDIIYEYDDLSDPPTSTYYYIICSGDSFGQASSLQSSAMSSHTGLTGKSRRMTELQEDDNEGRSFAIHTLSTSTMNSVNADYNGDGVNDIFIYDANGNWRIYSLVDQNGNITSSMNLRGSGIYITMTGDVLSADFNGDGKAEIWSFDNTGIKIYEVVNWSLGLIYSSDWPTVNHYFNVGDFNGDGKADIFLYGFKNGATKYDWTTWQIQLSTGTGFEQHDISQKKANLLYDLVRLGDFNGDGATDIMVTAHDIPWTGTYFYMSANNGVDFHTESLPSYPIASHNYYLADYDGDGRLDFICTDGQSPWWNGYQVYRSPGNTNILMAKVSDGMGVLSKLTYTKLSKASSSQYQKGAGTTYPVTNIQGPMSIVTSIKGENGLGSFNTQKFYYEGARMHLRGKGFLGYKKTVVTDSISSIENVSIGDYDQTYFYPTTKKSFNQRAGTTDSINIVTNTWANLILDADRKRIFPYLQSVKQVDKLTGHFNTTTAQYDNFGNPTSIVKSFNNGVSESTTNQFSNFETSWLLGRPTSTAIQYSDNDTTIIRSTTRVFGSTNNSLISETLFPGTSNEITNFYHYTSYGVQDRDSTISGGICRKTSSTYCSDHIRVHTSTDVLGHIGTATYDDYGRLSQQQDYLGNITYYQYDDFGRQILSHSADGSEQTTQYDWESPETELLQARFSILKSGNDNIQSKTWYDKLGRTIRSDIRGFDGRWVCTATEYNLKGQIESVSDPFYTNDSPMWTEFDYDDYGRKTGMKRPSGRNSTWGYSGSTITETTGGKSFSKTYASDGTLSSAQDAGGTINYTYYPDGKLKNLNAPGGINTRTYYDGAGNQKKLVDPSAGTIKYSYNGFGELITQVTPGPKSTTMFYNTDGRIARKVTTEGTTKYRYNTNKQLVNESSPDIVSRTFRYDNHGRIISTIDSIPGTTPDSTTFSFDNIGRLSTITHPSGIVETKNYNTYGYLSSISTDGNDRWTITSVNTRGQVTGGHYANNLIVANDYDPYGFLTSITTGSIQDFSYYYNHTTGNLTWRQKGINLKEDFQYDDLDRLDSANVGSYKLGMSYDSNKGGITTKSDVGTFHYDYSNKPYAVSSINPSTGLISSKDSINYTSFEKVKSIFENKHGATFLYNSDDERSRMIVADSVGTILTRWYPSENCIKEIEGNVTKLYTFIGGDIYSAPVVAITKNDTTIYYDLLRDNLGSITHIVNSTTNQLVAEYSYDAWGRMRNSETWVDYPLDSLPVLFVAGRGFTSHEHLPWFNLINMNGRVYDPLIGSFISPDNNVQAPNYTQNLNRYSYCFNNPLVYTDPSGEIIFTILAAIFCPPLLPMAIQTDIGWITGGISSKQNGGSFWEGALKGGAIGAINGALSMISPIKIPFGNSSFGLSIAPQFAVGTDGIGFGVNATLGYDLGKGFNAGVNLGGTYYASAAGTGASGFEGRIGYGIGYQGKHFQAGIGSTYFFSGETSQLTGQIYAGGGKWKLTYENDTWAPVPGLLSAGGADRDKFRTAAMRFDITGGNLKGSNAGFNIFTGESNGRVDANGNFIEPGNRYRMGALYVGYGNYRIGYNSERNIRGAIQNGFHDLMNYPNFEVLNISDKFYGGYYSSNPYTTW